jgi:pantoate--beta-alanine ligase
MLEVEMKFRDADFAALEARLAAWGAGPPTDREDADHYFNAPHRDFARTDEALRLRRIGEANFVTYKGPKRDLQTKTRTEVEIPLAPGDAAAEGFAQVLQHLGFRPVAVVRKRRRLYTFEREGFHLEVCLDDVAEVGRFAELEIQATEQQLDAARDTLLRAAQDLGLSASERRAYLQLLLEQRGDASPGRPAVAATVEVVREAVARARSQGRKVGLVPTMGALHAGHASLIETARKETGFVVVTIFVNPAQFGPREDLTRYPRPLEQDLELCTRTGANLVFVPDVPTVYPADFRTHVEVAGLQDVLEGASRPGHFRGVCTVVLKLFNIVQPDVAYFGQKDAQQARIVTQMVRDLNVPVELRVCPTVRESDGLALSSRNRYLDANQRGQAAVLFRALQEARAAIDRGERDAAAVRDVLARAVGTAPLAELDYAAVVDARTLAPADRLAGDVLLALAVRFGTTRLIDNLPLSLRPAADSR